nr:DUF6709 family protein [uncultured Acetatifactor sp.]
MKKIRNIVTMVCALAAAAALWMQAGSAFMKLQAGAEPLDSETEFGQVRGEYISYEAAYPVGVCVEEYYSGDPDRVRTYGYVVYDMERQTFLYIVVPEQYDGRYSSLLYNLQLAVELRAGKDMTPAREEGSLELMDQAAIDHAMVALEESEIVELYNDVKDDKVYSDTYFGDEYGEIMAAVSQEISRGVSQSEWYRIDSGSINGMTIPDIWICILAAGLSALIAVGNLISLFTGGRAKQGGKASDSAGAMERFLDAQRGWVEEWCQYCLARASRSAYLSVAIWVVILVGIGYFAKTPTERIFTFSLPLGLLLGELTGLFIIWVQRGQAKPRKILKRMEKGVRKALPSAGAQEEFAEDFLKAGEEWAFRERKKNSMLYGRLGSRYWSAFFGTGVVTIVEVEKLERVEPETISGSYRSGKVRVSYESYVAKFYYQGTPLWENGDKAFSFETTGGRDAFLALAVKRGVDGVKIREA